ncbi:4'-phosphopantetheinyl transferase superfamily protein [Roseobacter sp.]|uniref:4'-phosphopantetheinyl transferase family protein n=1 Tax=Roseobacter sp. TaxID=1907202 RepID=UPI00329A4B9D
MTRVVSRKPWITCAGLAWRWCHFDASTQPDLHYASSGGVVRVALPADLNAAVPKRRGEFLAGRLCATLALRDAGCAGAVGRAGRAPVWPHGWAGSISHAGDLAMAVVSKNHARVGVDCEAVFCDDVMQQVADVVLHPAEYAARPNDMGLRHFATLAFSAKEAAFKALSADLPDIPDFKEASVSDVGAHHITLRFRDHVIPVQCTSHQARVVTLVTR